MLQHYYPNNVLPAQQIIQANGKQSIDVLRMMPNSSVLIADSTAPIVWKCVSDGLGNVCAEAFDISPHKSQEQAEKDTLLALVQSIDERLKRLENEQSIVTGHSKSDDTEFVTSKKDVARGKKSTGNFGIADEEQPTV